MAICDRQNFFRSLTLGALLLLLSACPLPRLAAELLQPGDTIAVCGDSITEQRLYSVFIADYLLMCQPAADQRVHQFGWSGEHTAGLVNRISNDVAPFHPTVVTTCYGMNDGGYTVIDPARQDTYRRNTESIVKLFKAGGARLIIVGSPGAVDSDTFDQKARKAVTASQYNATLADLAKIARDVATEQKVAFADVHRPMLDVMTKAKAKYGSGYHVGGADGVHPAANGHLVMAYAFLKALGCTGDIGTITVDLRSHRADASSGHRVLRFDGKMIEVESTRYPFCFYGSPASPDGTRSVIEFLPFNEELNRFRFVVKGATAPRFRLTWGSATKIVSATELEEGVNLAAIFPENPFCEPFKAVEAAIKRQQEFETAAIKGILHALPGWSKTLPEEGPALDQIARTVLKKTEDLAAASRAAVVPVRHTLLIEPDPERE